jgi:hypothetical protein
MQINVILVKSLPSLIVSERSCKGLNNNNEKQKIPHSTTKHRHTLRSRYTGVKHGYNFGAS